VGRFVDWVDLAAERAGMGKNWGGVGMDVEWVGCWGGESGWKSLSTILDLLQKVIAGTVGVLDFWWFCISLWIKILNLRVLDLLVNFAADFLLAFFGYF